MILLNYYCHQISEDSDYHDDVIKWKHFPCYWPFVQGIHRSPVNSPHKGQWRGALVVSLIWAWINGWVNNREAVELRRHSRPLLLHCNVQINAYLAGKYYIDYNYNRWANVLICADFGQEEVIEIIADIPTSHYLNPCWFIANLTLMNKLKWI